MFGRRKLSALARVGGGVLGGLALAACISVPDQSEAGPGAGAGGTAAGGGTGALPGDGGVCPSGQKLCAAKCVDIVDPAWGCGDTSCSPCAAQDKVVDFSCEAGACKVESCETGFGDCNDSTADGCEKNVSNDSAHCGACDWSCGKAPCSAGLCAPEEIATGLQLNRKVAVDGAGLYWATNDKNGLFIAKKDGTRQPGPAVDFPIDLDHDASHIYFVDDNELFRLSKSGGSPEVVGTGLQLDQIFVDDASVYGFTWSPSPNTAKIYRTDKSNPGALQEIHAGTSRVRWMTTDATTLYWTTWSGAVHRMAKTGGPVDTDLKANNNAWGVTVHNGNIYWCSEDAIHTAPVGGKTPNLFAGGQTNPRAIAGHGDYVFWTAKSSLMMQHVTAAGAIQLAQPSKEVQALAIDDTHVYFFEHTSWGAPKGKGYRMRRPPP